MQKRPLNPFDWHEADDQGMLVEGFKRMVFVSGQCAMSNDGHPQHPGDMRAQTLLSLENVAAVLAEAGMDLSHVVHLNTHVTDVDLFRAEAADAMAERLAEYGVRPPGVLSGTTRLGLPELIVELEAIAVG
ncbi:MAG: RidA family protein [Roseovarius sp.]|uniref:RidA family protein n=1 Tax=Roseovarius sp. TaxID=1486281 RepID=UPI0032ED3099